LTASGHPEPFVAIQEGPVFDPEQPFSLRLGCATERTRSRGRALRAGQRSRWAAWGERV